MSNRIELSELETFLYASADILRGYVEASDYKSYVFPLLFFKRVCDVYDEETANATHRRRAPRKRSYRNRLPPRGARTIS